MKELVILAVLLISGYPCYGDSHNGKLVGSFPASSAHKVEGTVYAVDESTVRIVDFKYDGLGPDAFFWYSTSSNTPRSSGLILPFSTQADAILKAYEEAADLFLTLPDGTSVNDLKWLSVWCRQFSANFGHVTFPSSFAAPKTVELGMFDGSTSAHGVSSEKIMIIDARTIRIPKFNYDGKGPDAFFLVGKGTIIEANGITLANEMGSTAILGEYVDKNIDIMLPEGTTFNDIEWLSVYCKQAKSSFSHITIPQTSNLPPNLGMLSPFGYGIGPLSKLVHLAAGSVHIADKKRIIIRYFSYDGLGPDAFLYIGKKNVHSSTPSENGMIIPNEKGSTEKLSKYDREHIVLTLPAGVEVTDIMWLSVWCKQAKVNFGSIMFPSLLVVPGMISLGSIPTGGHAFRVGEVVLMDMKRIKLIDLHYDGTAPDPYFLVGTGPINKDGTKVPDENGLLTPLKEYTGQTIILTLPGDLTVNDIDWLSMYCIQATANFGQVYLPEDMYAVPPYLDGPATDLPNCEQMNDKFNVAWMIDGDKIIFEFTGALDGSDGYMAFGVSGATDRSKMVDSDPMVVYLDKGTPKLADYSITAYALCSDGNGVCPDTSRNSPTGTDDLTLISAYVKDGVTIVKFSRPLAATDSTFDKMIPKDAEVYIVWATGDVNDQNMVTKHKQRLISSKKINFGRSDSINCEAIEGVEEEAVTPWKIPLINGKDIKTFNAKIGPTGGKPGYEGITGQISWGIAWYINGELIPVLGVKRGDTYTFKVEGGDDPTNQARYHPLYITDDPKGGYKDKTAAEKMEVTNFAGTFDNTTGTYGTDGRYCEYTSSNNAGKYETFEEFRDTLTLTCDEGKPAGSFNWTVPMNAPDTLYYQCFTHNYLGWKIMVVDNYDEISGGISHVRQNGGYLLVASIIITVMNYL